MIGLTGGSGSEETATQSADVVELYEQSPADYVVVAFANNSWIKIVRRDTKAVLFADSIGADRNHRKKKFSENMIKVLRALGVTVRS